MQKIDIASQKDLEVLLDAIMSGEKFEIGEIKPIPFVLRFSGDRFKVQDGYISAEFAETLVSFKREYRNFLVRSMGKTKAKEVDILFKVEDGSIQLDFLNDLPQEFWNLVGKMDGTQLTITAVIALIGYFSNTAWKTYLQNQKEKLDITASAGTSKEALDVAHKAIDALMMDKKLEASKNKPINQALSTLKEGEALAISDNGNLPIIYQAKDADRFSYNEEEDDVNINLSEDFAITGFEKKPYGWDLHLKAISKETKPRSFWATSKLSPDDNIKLFHAADKGETKNISAVVVTNRDKIKEAYITAINQ